MTLLHYHYPRSWTLIFMIIIILISNEVCMAQRFLRRRLRTKVTPFVQTNFAPIHPPTIMNILLESINEISRTSITRTIRRNQEMGTNTTSPTNSTTNTSTSPSWTDNVTATNSSHYNNTLSPSEKEFIEEFIEKEEEIIKKKEEIVAEEVGGISLLMGILFMIFTAYQMSENPDGICASLCRLTFTIVGCFIKILLWPFKKIFGHRFSGYAHHLVATQEYGETSLFQIS